MVAVTVLIPAYNEETTILELLRKVAAQDVAGVDFEVIVVNDGSSDKTAELLEANPGLYTRLVNLSKNGGKGAAVIAGLEAATGDFVLFQDADLEYDPADYAKIMEPVARFDADIVMGSRLIASPLTRVSYFWHKFGNRVITLLFNIVNNTTFTDIYSCYLFYRRDLVDVSSLKSRGWGQHAEILTRAVGKARRIYEVPVSYYGRTYEEGKKIRARHIFPVIWTIILRRISS